MSVENMLSTNQIQDTAQFIMPQQSGCFDNMQCCPCQTQCEEQECQEECKKEQPKPKPKPKPEPEPNNETITVNDSFVVPVPCRGQCIVDEVNVIPQQVTATIETRVIDGVEQSVVVVSGSYLVRVHCLNPRLRERQFYYLRTFEQVVPISMNVTSATIVSSSITQVLIDQGNIYIDVEIEVELSE